MYFQSTTVNANGRFLRHSVVIITIMIEYLFHLQFYLWLIIYHCKTFITCVHVIQNHRVQKIIWSVGYTINLIRVYKFTT